MDVSGAKRTLLEKLNKMGERMKLRELNASSQIPNGGGQ